MEIKKINKDDNLDNTKKINKNNLGRGARVFICIIFSLVVTLLVEVLSSELLVRWYIRVNHIIYRSSLSEDYGLGMLLLFLFILVFVNVLPMSLFISWKLVRECNNSSEISKEHKRVKKIVYYIGCLIMSIIFTTVITAILLKLLTLWYIKVNQIMYPITWDTESNLAILGFFLVLLVFINILPISFFIVWKLINQYFVKSKSEKV